MAHSTAKQTHVLYDEHGNDVGCIYTTDKGIPLVHFSDLDRVTKTDRLFIKPPNDDGGN